MEKAILKTLIYADIFYYPMKTYEIHKWLIGKKVSLREVEEGLKRLIKKRKIESKNGFYFFYGKNSLPLKRKNRYKQSLSHIHLARLISILFKLVPWIKLVGISGNLSMENASKSDDIDLFVISSKNRLWISRLLLLGILSLMGKRRKRRDTLRKSAGKICINLLLEEDKLEQQNKDIYLAHEVLQMKVLWQRDGIYGKYLEDNNWAFKFLPNWVSQGKILSKNKKTHNTYYIILNTIGDVIEILAKWLQLKLMGQPQGLEHIQDGALYFHPNDCRIRILTDYQLRIKSI